jgi:hypothetical protein
MIFRINNCVGHRNQKFFYLFIFWGAIYTSFVGLASIPPVYNVLINDNVITTAIIECTSNINTNDYESIGFTGIEYPLVIRCTMRLYFWIMFNGTYWLSHLFTLNESDHH